MNQVLGCVRCRIEILRWPRDMRPSCPQCQATMTMIDSLDSSPRASGLTGHSRGAAPSTVQKGRGLPSVAGAKVTEKLPSVAFSPPLTVEAMLSGGGSALGLSAVTSYMTCPEMFRLRQMRVRRRRRETQIDGPYVMDSALDFGVLIHTLRATRLAHGQDGAMWLVNHLNIDEMNRLKAINILKMYDHFFPLGLDPWDVLGIEVEVVSDIGDGHGGSLLRSVRYDTVIRHRTDGALFSFECKTAARSGSGVMEQYSPQKFTHAALWNSNPNLVAQHGVMAGTLYDMIVKTEVPKCDRHGPFYTSKLNQQRGIEFLRLPDQVPYPTNADGSATRMLNACWGRYSPCEYIMLCHEGAHGDYEVAPRPDPTDIE